MNRLNPRQEVAIAQIHLEVLEETPLCFIGRVFDTAAAADTQVTGMIGWPFASWLLIAWLDAEFIDVCFDADLQPDAEQQALGWSDRAESSYGYLALRAEDARTLLSDLPRWHASRITGGFYPLRTDATDDLPFEHWMLAARQSPTSAPPLGANPELLDSVAWQNSRAPWEDIAQGKKLH